MTGHVIKEGSVESTPVGIQVAPWIYRQRAAVFGMIYGLSFFFGYAIAGVLGRLDPAFHSFGLKPWLATLAVLLAAGGFALRVWASSYLPASIVYHQDVIGEELRISGPYRFLRNPLYLGNVLQAAGVGLIAPWTVFAILVMAIVAFSFYLIGVEQKFLASVHGAAFEQYVAAVPALIPTPGKSLARDTQPSSLRAGLQAERYFSLPVPAVILVVVLRWH